MPGVELGLAAFDGAVTSAELLIWILKTVQKVRRLKKKCREIGEIAGVLQTVLKANEDAIKDLKTKTQLEELLRDVATFVLYCV
jgi:hypothetical protein